MAHALLAWPRPEGAVVHPLGQLRQHLGLAPAQHHRRQGLANAVQRAVADDAAGLVAQLVLVDCLFLGVARLGYEQTIDALKRTRDVTHPVRRG